MAFEILELTEAHLATVTNRIEKHGDDDKPAVSLGVEITTGNAILDLIDPTLRPTLYKRPPGQDDLPGFEVVLPVLQCNAIDRVTLPMKHEGWSLAVDDSIDEDDPMTFGSVKCDKFTVEPKQGGTIVLRFRLGTSDVDADKLGKLAMHVGQSIWITLTAPKPALAGGAIDGTQEAFDRDHPDAGDIFSQEHGEPGDETETETEGGDADADADSPWPFPREPVADAPATVASSSKRTARGRAATKAALAAGEP